MSKLTTGVVLGPSADRGKGTNSSVLQTNRLLRYLAPEQLSGLINDGYWERFGQGEALCEEGAPVDRILFIVEGHAETVGPTSKEQLRYLVVDFFGPGDAVGLLSLIDGAAYPVTVKAAEEVRALAVPIESLRSFLSAHPEWYRALAEMAVSRVRAGNLWLQAIA